MAARKVNPPAPEADEVETPHVCLACDGEFSTTANGVTPGEYETLFCRFCTGGFMSVAQLEKWRKHKNRRAKR